MDRLYPAFYSLMAMTNSDPNTYVPNTEQSNVFGMTRPEHEPITYCIRCVHVIGYSPLVLRPIGPTTHWSDDPLVLRPIGPTTHWSYGHFKFIIY